MPEPFEFEPCSTVFYTHGKSYHAHPAVDSPATMVYRFEVLIFRIHCLGVVGIDGSCYVNTDASLTPNNRAWFLLECSGTNGNFLIVTDGDKFFPVRRMPGDKLKVSMDLRLRNVDLSRMSDVDILFIKTALEEYTKAYMASNK